jgi:hypothetical protein
LFWAYGGREFQISKFPSKFGFIHAIALQIGLLTRAFMFFEASSLFKKSFSFVLSWEELKKLIWACA